MKNQDLFLFWAETGTNLSCCIEEERGRGEWEQQLQLRGGGGRREEGKEESQEGEKEGRVANWKYEFYSFFPFYKSKKDDTSWASSIIILENLSYTTKSSKPFTIYLFLKFYMPLYFKLCVVSNFLLNFFF